MNSIKSYFVIKPKMFKRFYNKSIEFASNKRSNLYLSIVSFVESSFFPIPPDVMIVLMVLAKKDSYLKIFFNRYGIFCSGWHCWLFNWLFIYRFSYVCD